MRESLMYGSGRGARGNSRPYRETAANSLRYLGAQRQRARSRRARSSPSAFGASASSCPQPRTI